MIVVETYKGKSVTEHRVEVVERKGTGHPDQMCDSMMEAISVALCREYLKEFGTILHHNIDKGLLAAGRVEKRFGGGKVIRPMELIIGDRATFTAGGKEIPVGDIAIEAAKAWLKENLRLCRPGPSPPMPHRARSRLGGTRRYLRPAGRGAGGQRYLGGGRLLSAEPYRNSGPGNGKVSERTGVQGEISGERRGCEGDGNTAGRGTRPDGGNAAPCADGRVGSGILLAEGGYSQGNARAS